MRTILLILLLSGAAQAQCYSRSSYGCGRSYYTPVYTPAYTYTYPSTNFYATYNLTFPPPAVSGATQFAYQPQNYFSFDALEALKLDFNNRARLADAASDTRVASLLIQEGSSSQERAFQLQKLEKLRALLDAPAPVPNFYQYQGESAKQGQYQQPMVPPTDEVPPRGTPSEPLGAVAIFKTSCIKCHGGGKAEGNLDLSDMSKIGPEVGLKILDRITTADMSKRMPRGATLSAKQILSVHSDFFQASTAQAGPKQ